MRRLCIVLALALSSAAQAQVFIDAGRGPILLRVPSGYSPASATPLVILLHGYGASGPVQESYMQFAPLVDEFGFLYIHPTGTRDCTGKNSWNATDACCGFCSGGADDAGYLVDLIDIITSGYTVDEQRIYLVGHSNGGFMSYRMACDFADRFAAIASLAGATFFDPADCVPGEPVHVLQIHGTSDATVQYGGGTVLTIPYPGAVQTVEQWASYNGCAILDDTSFPPIDLDAGLPGAETQIAKYQTGCGTGGSSELWTIVNGSHIPSLQPNFSRLVMEWLYAHPKTLPVSGTITSTPPPGYIEEGRPLDLIAPNGSGYVWKKDGMIVANDPPRVTGATTGMLQFNPVLATDEGAFTVEFNDGSKVNVVSFPYQLSVAMPGSLPLAGGASLAAFVAAVIGIYAIRKRRSL